MKEWKREWATIGIHDPLLYSLQRASKLEGFAGGVCFGFRA